MKLARLFISTVLLTIASAAEAKVLRGGVVYGNFPAPARCTFRSGKPHCIEVNFRTKTLRYYVKRRGVVKRVVQYKVITPRPSELGDCVSFGTVERIDRRPVWGPTPRIRQAYARRGLSLPTGTIPYGHRLNQMGDAKFIIRWRDQRKCTYDRLARIHGTRGYSGDWRSTQTFGCVRLMNGSPGIRELVQFLGNGATKEGITVVFHAT